MSYYANHIDYSLNEITGDRRTLIEVSKLCGISFALPHAPTMTRQIGWWNDNKVIVMYTV